MKLNARFKRLFFFILWSTASVFIFSSCHDDGEDQIKEVARDFSSAYFNWRYPDAVRFVTAGSRRWLAYVSSQVSQEDVDSLRAMKEGASFKIGDVSYSSTGSFATVKVTVSNFLLMDSIDRAPRVCAHGEYEIPLSYDGHEWRVKLSAPLRGTNFK